MRDDFSKDVKQKMAARAGHMCSNPDCRAATSGPQILEEKAVNVGVASHISAAAPGGPRYDAALTQTERANIKNGVWLCQICAKLIDSDDRRYSVEVISGWKRVAEQEAHRRVGKAKALRVSPSSREREIKRNLRLRDEMRGDLLKTLGGYTKRGPIAHPYEKFRRSEAIIHRIDDDCYPEMDESPGISSWFKVELFDFYHGGIKVILGIESGIIGKEFCPWNQHWAIIPYKADFDRDYFQENDIWKLGLIPFRNIRHYDPRGDENYGIPHLYCDFSINGMPYESFEHAVVGKSENDYDWPLRPELRLSSEAAYN